MSSKDLVNKRKQQKSKFELEYVKEKIVDYLAFLEQNPIEHSSLAFSLHSIIDEIEYAEQLLDGHEPFKLPEGYREKMTFSLVEAFVDGRDYSGYIREQSEYEIEDMSDEEFYQTYCECFYDADDDTEEIQIINTIEDILAKEELEEVINE